MRFFLQMTGNLLCVKKQKIFAKTVLDLGSKILWPTSTPKIFPTSLL